MNLKTLEKQRMDFFKSNNTKRVISTTKKIKRLRDRLNKK